MCRKITQDAPKINHKIFSHVHQNVDQFSSLLVAHE